MLNRFLTRIRISGRGPPPCVVAHVFVYVVAVFALSTAGVPSRANTISAQANLRHVLPGGRAALMGGAFTGVADDASATYYNPAGLVDATNDSIDLSVTAYRQTRTAYEQTVNDEPLLQSSEGIYPNFVGGVSNAIPSVAVGYSFLSLDARNIYQQNVFEEISDQPNAANSYGATHQEDNTYQLAGGGVAFQVIPSLSLGLSGFYYQRRIRATTIQLAKYNGGRIWSVDQTMQTLNTGMRYTLGGFWKLGPFAIGGTVQISRAISNHTRVLTNQINYDPSLAGSEVDQSDEQALDAMNELNPTTYRLGLSWRPFTPLLMAADLLYHDGVDNPFVTGSTHDFYPTLNYSVGLEVDFGPVALYGGYFTNRSLHRAPDTGLVGQPVFIDFVGTTGGIGWQLGGLSGTMGVVSQKGAGQAQVITASQAIQDVDATNITYLISGSLPSP